MEALLHNRMSTYVNVPIVFFSVQPSVSARIELELTPPWDERFSDHLGGLQMMLGTFMAMNGGGPSSKFLMVPAERGGMWVWINYSNCNGCLPMGLWMNE